MSKQAESRPRSRAEWTTLGIVVLILGILVGPLLWYALQPTTEASFKVTAETAMISEREGRFYVPLQVQNTGASTAEDVVIHAELTRDGQPPEEAEMTINFLSGGERTEVVAVFKDDPRDGSLEAGVTSYLIP